MTVLAAWRNCFLITIYLFAWNTTAQTVRSATIPQLKLLGTYTVPHQITFNNTVVGGLSGIDYDRKDDLYYLICDDRSSINPARFYKAKIKLTEAGIDTVEFLEVRSLLRENGQPFPSAKTDPAHTPDPESIRLNPSSAELFWANEGERIVGKKDTVLVSPSIVVMDLNGRAKKQWTLPPELQMSSLERGPRKNGALEGISFSSDFRWLYSAFEEPLYQDSKRAEVEKGDYWVRILKHESKSGRLLAQYAYPLEPVAYPSITPSAFKVNGISEILNWNDDQLLMMERSYSTGRLQCTIRIFLADLRVAEDVAKVSSMKEAPPKKLVTKSLLLNMDELGIYIDNVEGMTWGPLLPNGHRSLILVADNNFEALEKSQIFLFEVITE